MAPVLLRWLPLFVMLVGVAFLALLTPRRFLSGSFSLFRVLIPSWRFFEELGSVPTLYWRHAPDGEWTRCLPRVSRRPWNLFLNSKGNQSLASHGLVNQLAGEEEANPDSVPYRLVRNLVAWHIERLSPGETRAFQFKIQVADGAESEDVLVSEIHLLEPEERLG